MKPVPAEAERELLLTVAKVVRATIDDPTPGADDHFYLEALDAAIKRVERSEVVKPAAKPGGRPDGGMLYPIGDAAS